MHLTVPRWTSKRGIPLARGVSRQHGITNIADPTLNREELGWNSPAAYHLREELGTVFGDSLAGFIRRGEPPSTVRLIRMNNGYHLGRVDRGIVATSRSRMS